MRLLLIDDSSAYHEEFDDLLARSGLPVSTLDRAATVEEGSRLLLAGLHDAYVVDYRLPGDDGLTLIQRARAAGVTTPMILLTGFDSPEVDVAAQEAGANDYLAKGSFSPEALARSIRYATSNAAAIRRATEAERRFRMAQEVANIGTWDWTLRTDSFVWSPIHLGLFGLAADTAGPIHLATWLDLIHPDDRDNVHAAIIAVVAGRSTLDVTYRVLRPSPDDPSKAAALRWISSQGQTQVGKDRAPLRVIGVSFDVTERQNALLALRAGRDRALSGLRLSEARFRSYFESNLDCQFYVTRKPDGQFCYENVNPAGLAHAGLPLSAMIDRAPEDVLGPEVGRAMNDRLRQVAATGEAVSFETTLDMGSGSVTYDAIYIPVWDDTGTLIGVLGSARDITERRKMERAVQLSQRMETLGQLAGGVAHDFNNLLQDLTSCLDALSDEVTSAEGRTLIREGKDSIKRGSSLTGRLLAFSRQQVMTTEIVDLNAVVRDLSDVLARTLDAGTRVGHCLADGLWPVAADRAQVELALLNLGINARDAMPKGGTLTISTLNESISGPQPDDLAPGQYAALSVTDTGTGMRPDVLARALEPFFTTKEVGKGTGLGLSMIYGTLKQLGGGIRIASRLGEGTCVTLYLPRVMTEREADPKRKPDPLRSRAAVAATLLLVAKAPDTQATVEAYAGGLGHKVIVAADATEACRFIEAGQAVDAIVIEAQLGGVTSPGPIELVRRRRPGLPALLISPIGGDAHGDRCDAALQKPLARDAFAAALGAVLERPRSSPVSGSARGTTAIRSDRTRRSDPRPAP